MLIDVKLILKKIKIDKKIKKLLMKNYSEKFEKMRAAGNLAAKTLDMITDFIKPGVIN